MSGDPKRSILNDLRRPLAQPPSLVPAALEEKLLGSAAPAEPPAKPRQAEAQGASNRNAGRTRVPTVPVTFHLPVELRDRIKLTAQARQKTMLEVAVEALEEYLANNPVSEADLRRLLHL